MCQPKELPSSAAVSGVFHQLEQHASGAGRMGKDVAMTAGADLDFFVDEPRARGFKTLHCFRKIGYVHGDMVEALSALFEELRDRRVRRSGFEQFNTAFADRHH